MPEDEEQEEFTVLLAAFQRLVKSIKEEEGQWESLEELMALRADFIINTSIKGLGLTLAEAISLLERESEELSDLEKEQVKVIRAAIDNLVDFSVVEEYHLVEEVIEILEDPDIDEDDEEELIFAINKKYNKTYASVENDDAFYAMLVAAGWIKMRRGTEIMYMTMGDERVRPWHMQYEGYTAPKELFPDWLIPPIENRCRCFLVPVDDGIGQIKDVQNKVWNIPEMPPQFNRTFKESVAKGGRIFSDEHPYFNVDSAHVTRLREIAQRLKLKYFNA